MSKADKDGWIRHRGGKAPVSDDVFIDVRYRDGEILECQKFEKSEAYLWTHGGACGDIMAYRLHKQADQVEPFIEAVHEFNALAKVPQLEGPLKWRDRITEIDATTQALTAERADLVQKLASEGFALIGRINDLLTEAAQKHEDMSDWRNWKAGDFVEYVGENDSSFYIVGDRYVVERISQYFYYIDDEYGGRHKWTHCKEFKWHSRPSA